MKTPLQNTPQNTPANQSCDSGIFYEDLVIFLQAKNSIISSKMAKKSYFFVTLKKGIFGHLWGVTPKLGAPLPLFRAIKIKTDL